MERYFRLKLRDAVTMELFYAMADTDVVRAYAYYVVYGHILCRWQQNELYRWL